LVRVLLSGVIGIGDDGGANTFAPGVTTEGVDVFVLGELDGLDEGLAKIGEGRGGFGFYIALGSGGEEAAECGAETASGEIGAGEAVGDVAAEVVGGAGLGFLAGVEGAEEGMAGMERGAAVAAVSEGERTGTGADVFVGGRAAVLGRRGGGAAISRCDRRAVVYRCGRRTARRTSRHGSLQI
jgi:hypothetical protein